MGNDLGDGWPGIWDSHLLSDNSFAALGACLDVTGAKPYRLYGKRIWLIKQEAFSVAQEGGRELEATGQANAVIEYAKREAANAEDFRFRHQHCGPVSCCFPKGRKGGLMGNRLNRRTGC